MSIVSNMISLLRDPEAFYERAAAEADVVLLRFPVVGDQVLLSHPDHIERVLRTEADTFPKAEFVRTQLDDLLGQGLIQSGGDVWTQQRRLLQPAFFGDRIETYAPIMREETLMMIDEWEVGDTLNIDRTMRRLTLRILFRSLFGVDITPWETTVLQALHDVHQPGRLRMQPLAQVVPKWIPIPLWQRYHRGIRALEDVISEVIAQRGSRHDHDGATDLLGILLEAETEGTISATQVRDELMTFLFAAHETTATVLTFTWYLLCRHPEVDRQLVDELTTVRNGDASIAEWDEVEYTEQIILETMRLYPQVPNLFRRPTTDVEIGGYHVPAGTVVVPSVWATHRDDRWYDRPHAYRPERWQDDRRTQLPQFAYLPFGGGPRRCIGSEFALTEARCIVATIARAYTFELVSDPELDLSLTITTRPVSDITMRIGER